MSFFCDRCFRFREADEKGNRESLAADNFVRFSVVLGIALFILGLVQVILIAAFQNLGDLNLLVWDLAPGFALALAIASSVLSCLIHPVGLYGVIMENRTAAYVFFWASFPIVSGVLVTFVLLLMSGNGVAAVESRRVDSNDLIDNEMGLNSFSDITQDNVVRFAISNDAAWERIQDSLGCCGLNVRTLFSEDTLGLEDFDVVDDLLTGSSCVAALLVEVNQLLTEQSFIFNRTNLLDPAQFNEGKFPRLTSVTGLCNTALSGEVRTVAQNYSVMVGIQSFFHVVQMVIIGLLLYSYEVKEGGLKPNEASLDMQAKVENTVVAKAGYQSGALGIVEKPKFGTKPRTATPRFG